MRKAKHITVISSFLVMAIIIGALIYHGEWDLKLTKYTVDNEKITEGIRIVLLSDLHNREYGEDNCELLNLIKEQKPDIIAVSGDMISKHSSDTSVAITLMKKLKEITDVYYCLGNHENWLDIKGVPIYDELEESGVVFLDNQAVKVMVKGQEIAIGGLSSYPDYSTQEYAFLEKFEKFKGFKLLLCHYPEYYPDTLENYEFDLILSGHTHGGQVRLPIIGGLFAPEQGFFPKYSKGLYKSGTATMIISGGLGNASFFPRINNPPELVVIDVK